MNKILIFLLFFFSKAVSAQIPIDWAVCVEENNYYYTDAHTDDFKKVNKRAKFCYNDNYFGFVYSTDNYIQIFPLESYNMSTDNSGSVTEGFTNGECQNYKRGDITVEITHSKPQRIWINVSRQPSYAICIYTNALSVQKYKNKNKPKPDTLIVKKFDTTISDKERREGVTWKGTIDYNTKKPSGINDVEMRDYVAKNTKQPSGNGDVGMSDYTKKYIDVLKNESLNKYFICINKDIQTLKITDNKSSKNIENITDFEWKCTDIIDANYSVHPIKVVYILDDSIGNEIVVSKQDMYKYFKDK